MLETRTFHVRYKARYRATVVEVGWGSIVWVPEAAEAGVVMRHGLRYGCRFAHKIAYGRSSGQGR